MGVSKPKPLSNILDAYIEKVNGQYVIKVKEKDSSVEGYSLKYVDFSGYDNINTYFNHEVLYSKSFLLLKWKLKNI